jgi:hypothetical protein
MIIVHVYTASLDNHVKEKVFRDNEQETAKAYARNEFKKNGVYKVKVWTGKPIPNMVDAPGLLLELV